MVKKSGIRKVIRERARKRDQRKKRIQASVILIIGLALVASAWYLNVGNKVAKASLNYLPEDVVYDQPILAVHEMDKANLVDIPFLPKGGSQPKIAISETSYNFGNVGPTEVVQQDFVIANIGEAPLTISRVYTTCGCTTADFTASVIPPGKVSIMTVIFDAGFHDLRGQTVRRGVIIENNDPRSSQVEVWVEAYVRTSQ